MDVLGLDVADPDDISIMNVEVPPDYPEGKLIRFDLLCQTRSGIFVQVEIQLSNDGDMVERALYYHSKNVSNRLKKGQKYKTLERVITLIITDFDMFKDTDLCYTHSVHTVVETGQALTERSQISFLSLPKARKQLESGSASTPLLDWALFLSTRDGRELEMLEKKNPAIGEAIRKLEQVSSDPQVQYWAEMREKAEMDELSRLRTAEDRGIEKGIELGQSERTREIARALKASRIAVDVIMEATGLSQEEIEKL